MATTSDIIKYKVIPEKKGMGSSFGGDSEAFDKGSFNDRHGRGNMTDMLVFPSDVGADPGMGNQGHYIMFFVNETIDPSINVDKSEQKSTIDKLKEEYKATHKHETSKELQAWNQVLTKAGKKALRDRGEFAVVKREDIEAVGGEAIFDDLRSSYKDVPIWDKLDDQMIQGVGRKAQAAEFEASAQGYAASRISFNYGAKSTAAIKRRETKKLKGGIALYMPPSISTSSSAEYTDTEIGVGAAMAMGMIDQFQSGGMKNVGSSITATLNAIGPEAKESLQNLALNTMGAMPGLQGAAALRDMRRGFIRAPRMELAFKGIGKRNFSYEFKLIPKSEEEATTVKNIVTAFRANMLPEFINGADRSSRFFKMPNTFDISYMYNGRENQYIHKISTCVCKSVNVTYGGSGGYQTFENLGGLGYDGAAPIETSIALAFEELELITQERVLEGY